MKRKEFIAAYVNLRRKKCKALVKSGEMRASEAAMAMADAEREATSLWRRLRPAIMKMTPEEVMKL